jgi:hypothetical protein
MLGVISTSLGTVIERIEFGLELGYRQFQISFPSWGTVRLLPPYQGATEDAYRQFEAGLGQLPGLGD